MQSIGKYFKDENMSIIAKTDEKYLSFTVGYFKFIDSCAFLSASLDTLGGLLDKKTDFKNLEKEFKGYPMNKINLLKEKGIYPYEWFDDLNKFHHEGLPNIDGFYSSLNNEKIKDSDYKKAEKVYKDFNCKDFGDYHSLYLKTDILILADVFEKFRKMCLSEYRLDPLNYVSLPSFAWDCMLLKTGVELDLLHEQEMYEFFEKSIRGGISTIGGLRRATANNKYMKNYDKEKVSSFISYIDCNNLYGAVMSQKLPQSGFKWIDENNLNMEYLRDLKKKGYGFTIECDILCPKEIHDKVNDYPLLAENIIVKNEMLSDYQLDLKKKFYGVENKKGEVKITEEKVKKLVPNLMHKKNYVVHSDTLEYALKTGYILEKIHKGVSYKESEWLEKYIKHNSDKRKECTNDFDKDFYKLMNNAVYGMTMMNVRKFGDCELVSNIQKFKKAVRSNRLKNVKIFNEDLVLINKYKKKVTLNRPMYVGFAVLELSKLLMQKFWYDYLKVKYGEKVRLCMTDTDSFIIYVETEDLYKDMYDNREHYDLSNMRTLDTLEEPSKYQGKYNKYIKDNYKSVHILMSNLGYSNKYYASKNKAIIGKFKDETAGIPIVEFIGLQSKCYSNVLENGKQKGTAKGVKKSVKNQELKHDKYLSVANENKKIMIKQNGFKSEKHEVYTITTEKTGLSAYDTKRYMTNQMESLAFGHYSIKY